MRTLLKTLIGLTAALAASAGAALAAQAPAERANTMQIVIREPGDGRVSERLDLPLGQAAVLHLPVDAAEVMVANDSVADAVVRTPRRALLLGQAVGRTNIFFFDADGQIILDLDVRVERDMAGLREALTRFVPGGRIEAESMNANIVLSGTVPSASAADAALQVARRWADDPDQVVSFLAIEGREQVMLRVRIVEMKRTIVRQLGVNLAADLSTGGATPTVNRINTDNAFGLAGASLGGLSGSMDLLNALGGNTRLGATLTALERIGLVRTLAEPNITAISGEAAQFLAGGEFPVPVGRDRDGNITIEFKPFGVGLGFTPVVLSEGRISLRISTEVSELSNEGAISLGATPQFDGQGNVIGTTGGITIPALSVNRTQTTVELPSGGSLVIAGLIKEETRQAMDAVPGIERLPVLGSLFRSRDFANNETELVVLVTPYLVDPVNPGALEEPGEGFAAASMASNLILGRLNRVYAAPGARVDGRGWTGPVGFVLE
ncbi:type II and III secretion system protein family protein [Alkalicaulis satelles]|uniref:Type II and III secretion system protein family protein n=1 Tax=Alkalicaulis satelles TaxID=2609175 RepID=A0A5M6ZD05_9PROT|nr:type II and III secretion system protein family protein [Alkalicaulis satelles]KAA5802195.1 type II and III secretion system protein family protein [Alkalicaulis satelles]